MKILRFIIKDLIILILSLLITYGSFYIIYLISLNQGYSMITMMSNMSGLCEGIYYVVWVLLFITIPYIIYRFINEDTFDEY